MQPAVSVLEVPRVLPAWLRPSAFALVACLHLVVLFGVPWPAGTDIEQPRPVEIEVIPQPEPAPLLVPLDSAPAFEVKPATAAPVDVQAAEAQPLQQGQEVAELKPEPAFALNSPPGVEASAAPPELAPLSARPPTAALELAQPAPEAIGAQASAAPVDPASQAALPSSVEPVAESQPLDTKPAAAAAEVAQPSPPLAPELQVAESEPLSVPPAPPAETAQAAPAAASPDVAAPVEAPSQPVAPEQPVPESQPLAVPPAAAVESAQAAPAAASTPATAPVEAPSRPLAPEQPVAELQPLEVPPAAAVETAQAAPAAASIPATAPVEASSRPLAPEQPVPESQPLEVPPAAPVETAQAAPAAAGPVPAAPIEPSSGPLAPEQQVAESQPLAVPPAAPVPVPAAHEAQDAAAAALPIAPPSRPLSSDQQVAELSPLGPAQAAAPVPIAPGAPQLPMPESSAKASDAPAPGAVLPSGQPVAKLEPYSPGTAAPLQGEGPAMPGRVGQIVRYVEHYDGGRCFFVAPVDVTETEAKLEGYGASARPFEALDDAFRHENGFEASIDVRLVNPEQCPAVTFLGNLRGANAPHLRIGAANLGSGDVLTGSVDGFGSRNVALVLATDTGTVLNLSPLLKPGAAGKTFSITRRDIAWASGGQPQLLIVVASKLPLAALRFDRPIAADRLFAAVLSEAARTNQPIAAMARYFKIEQ